MGSVGIDEIIRFWFQELIPKDWFRKGEAVDATIASRFGATYRELRSGVPAFWLDTPKGFLAAILMLDQFPRNMFRGETRAFATDQAALALAKRAIAEGVDAKLSPEQRSFIYVPFQHSKDKLDQARSVALFTALGLDFALRHQAIVDRFGRFPHRNAVLGRASTEEEQKFLAELRSSF